jgi:uncharacterized protein YqgC (DUF456 family)
LNASRFLLIAFVGAAMVVGLAGTLIPVLPGLVLVWAAALVYGLAAGFGVIGWIAMVLITALLVAGLVASVRIPQKRAAQTLTGWARILPIVAAVVGFFVLPVVGAPVGFVTGVFVGNWAKARKAEAAWSATKVAMVGLLQAAGAQLAAGLSMIVVWLFWLGLER